MLPIVALVGQPNVGKSTLFNQLTKRKEALVVDLPGTTRDRQYGVARRGDHSYLLVDTGGIGAEAEQLDHMASHQTQLAIEEAHLILFVVDAKVGLTAADQEIAQQLRQIKKPLLLIVNKSDGQEQNVATSEFYSLGLSSEPIAIAAKSGRGVTQLDETITSILVANKVVDLKSEEFSGKQNISFEDKNTDKDEALSEQSLEHKPIKVAIIGRPNVGKSTLVNRILGEERVIASDTPGTTRTSIYIPFSTPEQEFLLIDTAGVRKRKKVKEAVEKYSVLQSLQAIESANVVIFILDATSGVLDQDLTLLNFVLEAGKGLVVAMNKWDGLSKEQRDKVKAQINYRMPYTKFARRHSISALHGTGVGSLLDFVREAYRSANQTLVTSQLTKLLQAAVIQQQPPMKQGRRIKLRYAHAGGKNPPRIIIHGNQTEKLPASYRRYLSQWFIKRLKLIGTPVSIEFKTVENPYV